MRKAIDLSRLRAAFRASGFSSFSQLSKEAAIAHTTISRLFSPKKHRPPSMNPTTAERLATTLRVPLDWLTGDRDALPFVPKHGLLSTRSPEEPEDLSEAKVRLSHLLARADDSLRRDLRDWYGDGADAAYQAWGWALLNVIAELAAPVSWRVAAVVPNDGDPGVFLYRRPGSEGPLLSKHSIDLFEEALAPWFDGLAHLNAGTLRDLLEGLFKNPHRAWGSEHTDAEMIRALGLYDAARATASVDSGPLAE